MMLQVTTFLSDFSFRLQMNFPYKECNPYNDKLDVYLTKELKETFCHLNQVSASTSGKSRSK